MEEQCGVGGTAGWTHQKMTSEGRSNITVTNGAGR